MTTRERARREHEATGVHRTGSMGEGAVALRRNDAGGRPMGALAGRPFSGVASPAAALLAPADDDAGSSCPAGDPLTGTFTNRRKAA